MDVSDVNPLKITAKVCMRPDHRRDVEGNSNQGRHVAPRAMHGQGKDVERGRWWTVMDIYMYYKLSIYLIIYT